MTEDLKIAQLLCTRLCHDLAGPVGAISAGVELMGSDPSLVDEETLSLLSGSADAAGHKLKFLRIAFGLPGGGAAAFDGLEETVQNYLIATSGPSGMPALDWPSSESLSYLTDKLNDTAAHIFANVVLLGLECIPSCRSLAVKIETDATGFEISVGNHTVEGRPATIKEDTIAAVADPDPSAITPRTVQAHLTQALVKDSGGHLSVESMPSGAVTTARWL